jgi:hypothetical protein
MANLPLNAHPELLSHGDSLQTATSGASRRLTCGLVVQVFVLGGSWSGGVGGKNGELFTPTGAGAGWRKLSGVLSQPILTNDPEGEYRADNHGWFFGWTGGKGASRGRRHFALPTLVCAAHIGNIW